MKKMMTCLVALMAIVAMTGCKPKASLHLTNGTDMNAVIVVHNSTASQDYELPPFGAQDIKSIPVDLMDSVEVQLYRVNTAEYTKVHRGKFPEATGLTRKYVVDVTGVSNNYPLVKVGLNSL